MLWKELLILLLIISWILLFFFIFIHILDSSTYKPNNNMYLYIDIGDPETLIIIGWMKKYIHHFDIKTWWLSTAVCNNNNSACIFFLNILFYLFLQQQKRAWIITFVSFFYNFILYCSFLHIAFVVHLVQKRHELV